MLSLTISILLIVWIPFSGASHAAIHPKPQNAGLGILESILLGPITRALKIEIEGSPVRSANAHGYVKLPTIQRIG